MHLLFIIYSIYFYVIRCYKIFRNKLFKLKYFFIHLFSSPVKQFAHKLLSTPKSEMHLKINWGCIEQLTVLFLIFRCQNCNESFRNSSVMQVLQFVVWQNVLIFEKYEINIFHMNSDLRKKNSLLYITTINSLSLWQSFAELRLWKDKNTFSNYLRFNKPLQHFVCKIFLGISFVFLKKLRQRLVIISLWTIILFIILL